MKVGENAEESDRTFTVSPKAPPPVFWSWFRLAGHLQKLSKDPLEGAKCVPWNDWAIISLQKRLIQVIGVDVLIWINQEYKRRLLNWNTINRNYLLFLNGNIIDKTSDYEINIVKMQLSSDTS